MTAWIHLMSYRPGAQASLPVDIYLLKAPNLPALMRLQADAVPTSYVLTCLDQPSLYSAELVLHFVIMGSAISLLTRLSRPSFLFQSSTDVNLSQPQDPNAALASELRGKTIHVDMTKSFQHWPSGVRHPEYKRLRHECDRVLEMYSPPASPSAPRGSLQDFEPGH